MIENLLIIGKCGVGKTWVMKKLLLLDITQRFKLGKFLFHESDKLIIIGKYDGSIFEGSDRLSMDVITDLDIMLNYINKQNKIAIFEGDRFSNSKFIRKANPRILKIVGSGIEGRNKRGSKQSVRHIKNISTKINNIKSHINFNNSLDCLLFIKDIIYKK
jgi:hypothetical protein